MFRIVTIALLACTIFACNKVDLKKSCQGEWAFFVNDTAYCELLINDSIVFPYHYGERNGSDFHYKINQDTFYIYANESELVEMSPIKYLGADSFKILAITPATLHRVKHPKGASNSLAQYHYKLNKSLRNKTAVNLVDQGVFPEIRELRVTYEKGFEERRELALYKRRKG